MAAFMASLLAFVLEPAVSAAAEAPAAFLPLLLFVTFSSSLAGGEGSNPPAAMMPDSKAEDTEHCHRP